MYASRHLSSAETRYSTTERELLAVVFCNKRFKAYLYGRHCIFIVDHEPLVTMRKLKDPMGRIGNLFHKLQDCDYTLIYQPGSLHVTPDLLSRPAKRVDLKSVEMQFESCVNWEQEQLVDPKLSKVLILVKTHVESFEQWSTIPSGLDWFKVKKDLVIEKGVLMLESDHRLKIVVPKQTVSVVLNLLHDQPLAGHRDFERTYDAIKSRYFWLSMHKDVKAYCLSCHLCQTKKYLSKPNVAPLKPIIVNTVWSLIGLDIAGPLKVTAHGNKYIVLAIDYFTKFCVAKAIPDFTALSTAKFVFEEVICKLGMPRAIISDKGVNFQSKLFEELCNLLRIKKLNSTFYHPEGVGMVERMVKIVKQIITMYINPAHTNWDEVLQSSISAYNTSKQASIKVSPYEALFVREPTKLADVLLATPVVESTKNVNEYVDNLKHAAVQLHASVNEHLEKARERQKLYYDREVRNSRKYKIGDLVSVINQRSIVGQSHAFKDRAIGPFKILSSMNDGLNFEILDQKGKVNKIHYNRLLPYRVRSAKDFVFKLNNSVSDKVSVPPAATVTSSNSIDFEVDFDFLTSLCQEPVILSSGRHSCDHCHLDLGTKRLLLKHINDMHADIILQNIQNISEFVIQESNEVVETVVLNPEQCSDDLLLTYVQCEICLNRFKRRGLHVHMRSHQVLFDLVESLISIISNGFENTIDLED